MNALERALSQVFDQLDIEYYGNHDQVPVHTILPESPPGEHFEMDGFALHGRRCIVVEITDQANNNREKVHRFIRHCDLLRTAPLSLRERFRLFSGIPTRKLNRFEDVNDWRYLYIVTSPELREKGIRPTVFPAAGGRLGIFWDEEWQYLKLLIKGTGRFARGELLAAIGLHPTEEGSASELDLRKPFIRLEQRKLAKGMPKADLFVAEFSPLELLTMCRVFRYQGLPMALELPTATMAKTGYQRLFIAEKLASIQQFVGSDPSVTFPNAITLICPTSEIIETAQGEQLPIPYRYASLDLIDGQHRLFGYAQSGVSEKIRRDARLLAVLIQFDEHNRTTVSRYATRTFVTINKNQARVKTELIYLTAYEAMGEDSGEAIAGKVLSECCSRRNGSLYGLLKTRPLLRPVSPRWSPVPIVTIVEELAPLVDLARLSSLRARPRNHLLRLAGLSRERFHRRADRLRAGIAWMNRLFTVITEAFPDDFVSPESNLFSAKYFAACVRLFRTMATEEHLSWEDIEDQFRRIAANALIEFGGGLAFPTANDTVPNKKASVPDIYAFLDGKRT